MRPEGASGLRPPRPEQGRQLAEQVVAGFPTCPIPEIARLGPTLRQWKDAFLAYFDTGRASNGGTESINGLIELHRRIARGSGTGRTIAYGCSSSAADSPHPHRKCEEPSNLSTPPPARPPPNELVTSSSTTWGPACPAIKNLWLNAWEEFTPFLDYDVEIRLVLCSTNAIESLNARFRRAVRARGHFPNEQSAMKTLYLVVRSLDPKGTGQTRWVTRWKPALNAFAITFADRMPAAEDR